MIFCILPLISSVFYYLLQSSVRPGSWVCLQQHRVLPVVNLFFSTHCQSISVTDCSFRDHITRDIPVQSHGKKTSVKGVLTHVIVETLLPSDDFFFFFLKRKRRREGFFFNKPQVSHFHLTKLTACFLCITILGNRMKSYICLWTDLLLQLLLFHSGIVSCTGLCFPKLLHNPKTKFLLPSNGNRWHFYDYFLFNYGHGEYSSSF